MPEEARAAARGPVTVAHVITMLELGGAQENTLHTVRHLDRSLFRPVLLAGRGGILDGEAAALPDVQTVFIDHLVREVRPLADLRALAELRRAIADLKRRAPGPLIVHTHSSKAGILGRWAARLAGADAVVHSVHGFGFNPRQHPLVRLFFVLLERATAGITGRFIAVSRANIRDGERLGIFREADAALIRSGIVLDDFRSPRRPPAEVRRELELPEGAPVVGMVACFKPQKAPLDFVRMARVVSAGRPDARFLVVGDGELREQVERAVREAGLQGKVLLLGWRRDVPDLLHLLDILVLTSRWEGLPRVCPQAMAAGKPVVATAVDGTPEAVADGETGYLVPPGEMELMAERVLYLLAHPEKAAALGQEGARRVAEFDAGLMVERQEELYRELLLSRTPRRRR